MHYFITFHCYISNELIPVNNEIQGWDDPTVLSYRLFSGRYFTRKASSIFAITKYSHVASWGPLLLCFLQWHPRRGFFMTTLPPEVFLRFFHGPWSILVPPYSNRPKYRCKISWLFRTKKKWDEVSSLKKYFVLLLLYYLCKIMNTTNIWKSINSLANY